MGILPILAASPKQESSAYSWPKAVERKRRYRFAAAALFERTVLKWDTPRLEGHQTANSAQSRLSSRSIVGASTEGSTRQMRLKNWIQPGLALAIGLAAPAILAAGAAHAAQIVYDVSLPSPSTWTLSGTITTDGTIGALSLADITAFDLTATNSSGASSCISGSGCTLYGSSAFSGSATQLTWDFDASPQAEAAFYARPSSYICFGPSNGYCAFGNQGNVAAYSNSVNTAQTYTGVQVLGSVAAIAAVPEPATWAMMIVGFGAMGGAMRQRKRSNVSFA